MKRTILAIVIAVSMLTLAPSAAQSKTEEAMSESQAGRYYLKIVCDDDAYWKFIDGVWKGRNNISQPEVRRRLGEVNRLAYNFGREDYQFARGLMNPPAPWPVEVAPLTQKMAARYLAYSQIRMDQGRSDSASEWMRLNNKGNRFNTGNYSDNIRAVLDLPPPGEGC